MEDNKIDFGSEYLNNEVKKTIKRFYGNGYHRIITTVKVMQEQGKTEIEIANMLRDIRNKKETILDSRLMELLEKKEVTKEELEHIQEHEQVEECSYEGLEFGHGGDYLFHVKLVDDEEIYSITTNEV